jgi:predicted aspartyl protease/Tfp pilus assembly protein PilF
MLRQALSRRLLLSTAVFLSVVIFAVALPAASQETKPSAGTQGQQGAHLPSVPATSLSAPPQDASHNLLDDATVLARRGNCDAAIIKYQLVLQESPNSPEAYAGLTRCYLKKKDVTQAYEMASKGLQISDGWPVRVALGEVYFRQGKIAEAEKEWVGVINSGHQAARAYLGVARVRWAISMDKTAKAMIDKAYELDPRDPDIQRSWIATLRRSGRIKYYEDYLTEASNLDADERSNIEIYLSYLKEQAKHPGRSCQLVSKVTNTTTPLVRLTADPKGRHGHALSVDLNGTNTNIMLDTGASGIVVKRPTAEKAGITKLAETKIEGVGDKGAKNAYIGTAKSIRIGELEFQDCPVEVVESRSVAGTDGLIGADVFKDFLVEIDFLNEKLKLSELPKRPGQGDQQLGLNNDEDDPNSTGPQDRYIAPEMQSFTPVFRFAHELLVPTKIGYVLDKLFLLDTGATENAISPEAAREITKIHRESRTIVEGVSGSVKNTYVANKVGLQFGNVRLGNLDMLSFDTTSISESTGTEVSGFLGFEVLQLLHIKIDYRDALIDFSFESKQPQLSRGAHDRDVRLVKNEAIAVGSLRKIYELENAYASAHPDNGFACQLKQLWPTKNMPDVDGNPMNLLAGKWAGYKFEIVGCIPEKNGVFAHYQVTAVPLSRMESGVQAFCTDQSGNVFYDLNGSASECLAVRLLLP